MNQSHFAICRKQLAMNDVAKSAKNHWSEPHHWAAFALFGETGKMQ